MKDAKKDILAKAIAEIKQRGASSAPPQELVNKTLAQVAAQSQTACAGPGAGPSRLSRRSLLWSATRLAAAAVVLIAAGYAFGRIAAPKPDIEELRAALLPSLAATLEPAIRARVVEETTRQYEQAMVAGYVRLRDDLTEQYRAEINRASLQTFSASSTATNRLLGQFIEAMRASQEQDRLWLASVLEQMDAKRVEDSTKLSTALVSFAAQTETKMQRTEDMIRLLANTQPDTSIPYQDESGTMN
jgi:hypothetical protein